MHISLVNLLEGVHQDEKREDSRRRHNSDYLMNKQENFRSSGPGTMNGTGVINQYNSTMGHSSNNQHLMPGQRENPGT